MGLDDDRRVLGLDDRRPVETLPGFSRSLSVDGRLDPADVRRQ